MKTYLLHRAVVVPRPLDSVFDFFADPRNLARITPPWLAFEMVGWEAPPRSTVATGPLSRSVQQNADTRFPFATGSGASADPDASPAMVEGLRLHYRVRPLVVPQRWTSEITVWDPPHRFTDEQRRGPYRLWRHEHTFEDVEAGTRVEDRVHYALPFGAIGRLAHMLLVRHQLRRIFEFRLEAMKEIFGFD